VHRFERRTWQSRYRAVARFRLSQISSLAGDTARVLAAAIIVVTVAAGCSTPSRDNTSDVVAASDMAGFTVSRAAVIRVVQDALADAITPAKLNGLPVVTCSGEKTCAIAYTVMKATGIGRDIELIQPTRQIWKALFLDARFDSGIITVSGPVITDDGNVQISQLFTLRCNRDVGSAVDWKLVSGLVIRRVCDYSAQSADI
jgi:hypothetical protein